LGESYAAAFTPPSSQLPDAQPGDAIVYTEPHGARYTKPQIDSTYDQVCWQQDPPDTGTRDSWMMGPSGAPRSS